MDVSGMKSLAVAGRLLEVEVSLDELESRFFTDENLGGDIQIIRAAKAIGLKAGVKKCRNIRQLEELATPFLLKKKPEDGLAAYVVVVSKRDVNGAQQWFIHDPSSESQQILTDDELCQRSDLEVVLITRRFTLQHEAMKFSLSYFFKEIFRYKSLLSEVFLASFFIQVLALVSPIFFQVVVDKVLTHQSLSTLDVLAIGMLAVITFDVLLTWLRNYQMSHTAQRIDVTLGSRVYDHLLGLPMGFFQSRQVGTTVARVHELKNIREFLTGSTLTLCLDVFFSGVFLAVMFFYSPTLTYVVLGMLVPYVLMSVFITPILRKRLAEQFQRGAENQAFLVESVSGIETVKAQSIEPQMQRRWDEQLASFVTSSFKTQVLSNSAQQFSQWINKITMLLILWIGARIVIEGGMTVGELIAFNMFASQVSAPILRLVQLWQQMQQAKISVERLGDILNTPREKAEGKHYSSIERLHGDIRFEGVHFAYSPDSPPVLDDISFEVSAGEVIGIVGASGSGKSTLTKLIQKFYLCQRGRICIDGVDIKSLNPETLRKQVGVVLQESNLFNRTVKENIAIAFPGAPIEDVIKAAKLAGAHDFIGELPDGYNTVVGERGGLLSGGQKQRIAIARALMGNPRVLIFDEATSALDYESESVIQRNMADICRDRTVIIIAHRLSTVQRADRVLVLERGQVVEQGSWEWLLKRNGQFSRLHDAQFGRAS